MVLVSSVADAQEPETVCEDPRVRIQGRPDERWLEPIVRACEDLGAMPDGDQTARVRIVPAGHELIIEIVLKDGRSTLRRIREPAALKPTLEALLTVPAASAPADPPPAPASPARSAPAPGDEPPSDRPPVAAPPPRAPTFGVEIGGAVGGRVTGGETYLSVGPGGYAQIRVEDWLFGMSARWEAFQYRSEAGPSGFEMETLGAGFSAARRFHPMFGSIDVGISPRLVAETQSFLAAPSDEHADTQTDVRLGAFMRTGLGHASPRFFAELDAELSPGRLRRDIRIEPALPPLPAWSAGLSLGAVWAGL